MELAADRALRAVPAAAQGFEEVFQDAAEGLFDDVTSDEGGGLRVCGGCGLGFRKWGRWRGKVSEPVSQ